MSYRGQSPLQSMVESFANILVGWGVALISQVLLFPLFQIHVSLKTNLWISIWFTIISLIRSYALRRYFNWSHRR